MSKPLREDGNGLDCKLDCELPNVIPWPVCSEVGSIYTHCGNSANHTAGQTNRLHAILDKMPDAVLLIDRELRITFMNGTARELFGDNQGTRCSEGLGEDKTLCEYCPLIRSLKDGSSRRAQVEYVLAGGCIRHLDISVTPLAGEDGSINECLLVGHDMTSQRVAERQRRDMLSMVSHDLKIQMSIILAGANLLIDQEGVLDKEDVRAIRNIIASAKNTSTLMDDFLCLSKLESGKLSLDAQPMSLSAIVSYTLDTVRQLVEDMSAAIHIDFSEKLPEVIVDMDRFVRIFTNIITNALKYGGEGVNIWIRTRAEQKDTGMVRLEISDDGPGIPENMLPYVFDNYYTNTLGGKSRGHGLGLAIVKNITELHGGTVEIRSTQGHGTSVILRLPSVLSIR